MVMPDDKNITFTNCIGMGLILSMNYAIAHLLHFFHATMLELLLACFGLFLVSVFMINKCVTSLHWIMFLSDSSPYVYYTLNLNMKEIRLFVLFYLQVSAKIDRRIRRLLIINTAYFKLFM